MRTCPAKSCCPRNETKENPRWFLGESRRAEMWITNVLWVSKWKEQNLSHTGYLSYNWWQEINWFSNTSGHGLLSHREICLISCGGGCYLLFHNTTTNILSHVALQLELSRWLGDKDDLVTECEIRSYYDETKRFRVLLSLTTLTLHLLKWIIMNHAWCLNKPFFLSCMEKMIYAVCVSWTSIVSQQTVTI